MSQAQFQASLAQLVIDPDFRDAVQERGAAALPADLTPRERERLVSVAHEPGLGITRTLHKGFRLGKLLSMLPSTCALLGDEVLAREVGAFWQERVAMSFSYLEEADAFGAYLERRIGEGLDTQYLADVVGYERAVLDLQRARPPGERVVPRVVRFTVDAEALLAALATGRVPADLPETPCTMIGDLAGGAVRWRRAESDLAVILDGSERLPDDGVAH